MTINKSKFSELIEKHAMPRWEQNYDDWELRPGGGELYIQKNIFERANPFLSKSAITQNTRESLLKALSVHVNLLFNVELMHAKTFIERTDESDLKENFTALLFKTESLKDGLQHFLAWSKVHDLPSENKKAGINHLVASYFLSMADPKKYPFCKPGVYEYIVRKLISPDEIRRDKVERIVHCQYVYSELLNILEKDYNLEDGNLLDVHSICFLFKTAEGGIEEDVQYWTYAPGKDAIFWEEYFQNGTMGIGWDYLGDLKQYGSKDDILTRMKEVKGGDKTPFNSALACQEFANVMQIGDVVFAKKGLKEIIGYGIVDSEYYFDPHRDKHKHMRKVKWIDKGSWPTGKEKVAMKTLTNISPYSNFVKKLKEIVGFDITGEGSESDQLDDDKRKAIIYDQEKELKDIFIPDNYFWQIIDLLKHKKNIIVQGPPGVGKTFVARHLAYAMVGVRDDRRIGMVQFHQSYSYEDFVQGYRPDQNRAFYLKNGIFLEFCKKASEDPENDYFFIIDEINRGNLSKILGELMVLIEPDKRGKYHLPLTYALTERDTMSVPGNLYLIGTMNTADRSLALVDYALRRRFCFVSIEPAYDTGKFNNYLKKLGVPEPLLHRINRKLKGLNTEIAGDTKNLGPGFCIGHSYFCTGKKGESYNEHWYRRIVNFEIGPLLQEYWFDNPERAEDFINLLKG